MILERRFVKGAEIRAKKGEKPALEGYAAVFGQDYVLYESKSFKMVERIKQGAFTRTLEEKQDVRCLFNHDPDNLLGRTANGTLSLAQDSKGLKFDNNLDDRTHIAQDVHCFVDRGDVTGCSFAFIVRKQTWTETEDNGFTLYLREIEDLDTFDVGPVTYPAYEGTSVDSRSFGEMRSRILAIDGLPAELRSRIEQRKKSEDDDDGGADDKTECNCRCDACSDCTNKRSADPLSVDTSRDQAQADVDARLRRAGLKAS